MLSGNITEKNLRKAHPDDFEKIMGLPGQSLAEKYFIYINGPHKGCEYCGAPTRFLSFNKGYKKYCSRECACNDPGLNMVDLSVTTLEFLYPNTKFPIYYCYISLVIQG